MDALTGNEMWNTINISEGFHLVDSKWVYAINYKPDGTTEKYKVILIAREFSQKYGTDY